MDASTCAKRVVGIFINFIPLFVTLEINPERSPKIPPPNPITQSDLLKLFMSRFFINLFAKFKFFTFSFTEIL